MTEHDPAHLEPEELQRDTSHGDGEPKSDGLTAAQEATLLRLLRVAYPHSNFPDGPYERTAQAIRDTDGAAEVLASGLDELAASAGGDFAAVDDAQALSLIEKIQDGPLFKLVHSTTVVALYDDHQVWEILGYEGSSFEKGGYLHRGFNDLDWLPDPRVEEYTAEKRVELVEEVAR